MRTLIVNSLLDADNIANRLAADASDFNLTFRTWHRRWQVAINDAAETRKNSIEQLAIRTRSEASHERQRMWLAAILRRGTGGAVNAFLELAGDPAIAPAAFEAAKEADSRTIDKLFEALQCRRVATRQTAAQVLGALNRPQVSQRLAQMAMESPGRREALIGLLSSSDPVARKFVADAQHNSEIGPSLRALVRF
jgi:molybdopterin-guanine dinucleotide biosynthesis protein A